MSVVAAFACSNCGSACEGGARFCTSCGTPQAAVAAPSPMLATGYYDCQHCGGVGQRLTGAQVYCPGCRWLRPLSPDYHLDVTAFIWDLDAQAMSVLQSLGPITAAAAYVANKGRAWFEAATNGVRLSERQFPEIFTLAIRAARIMGLERLPEIYLSGEVLWDAMTLGNESESFIVLGSVLTYFKGDELLFLLAREMGHVRAGHVMWRTASKFMTGSTHMNRTIMGGGLVNALRPGKILENAFDAPVMAWARQSEITADRAAMLVVGDDAVARKVLMSMSLKSFPLYQRLDQDSWREQEDASDDTIMRLSEMTMSTQPYLARRLRMLREFAGSDHVRGWRAYIESLLPPEPAAPAATPTPTQARKAAPATAAAPSAAPAPDSDAVRFACRACHAPIRVPRAQISGRPVVRVRCPQPDCRTEMNVRPPRPDPNLLRFQCVKCATPVAVPRAQLAGRVSIKVRCPKPDCRCIMDVASQRST